MEEVTLPMLAEGAKPVVVATGTYTVPAEYRLHLTHAWSGGGTVVASEIERDIDTPPFTILGGAGTLSGLDLWIPAGATVAITGTAGFVGWLSPPRP